VHSADASSGDREPYKRVVMSPYTKMGSCCQKRPLDVRRDYCCVDPEVARVQSGSHRLHLGDDGKRLLYHPPHQLRIFSSDGHSLPDDVNLVARVPLHLSDIAHLWATIHRYRIEQLLRAQHWLH